MVGGRSGNGDCYSQDGEDFVLLRCGAFALYDALVDSAVAGGAAVGVCKGGVVLDIV